MNDPFEALGIEPTSGPDEIRRRYLELVRRFPPESEPERFAEIRAAYDAVRDPIVNLENRLFSMNAGQTLDALVAEARPDVRARRIPTDVLLSLGRA